ncbi:MAG: hypothetical protein VXY77_03400 [Pseudomonadota bacterium]|nr:hypothetical protein [Pseudomonadota bacterium]
MQKTDVPSNKQLIVQAENLLSAGMAELLLDVQVSDNMKNKATDILKYMKESLSVVGSKSEFRKAIGAFFNELNQESDPSKTAVNRLLGPYVTGINTYLNSLRTVSPTRGIITTTISSHMINLIKEMANTSIPTQADAAETSSTISQGSVFLPQNEGDNNSFTQAKKKYMSRDWYSLVDTCKIFHQKIEEDNTEYTKMITSFLAMIPKSDLQLIGLYNKTAFPEDKLVIECINKLHPDLNFDRIKTQHSDVDIFNPGQVEKKHLDQASMRTASARSSESSITEDMSNTSEGAINGTISDPDPSSSSTLESLKNQLKQKTEEYVTLLANKAQLSESKLDLENIQLNRTKWEKLKHNVGVRVGLSKSVTAEKAQNEAAISQIDEQMTALEMEIGELDRKIKIQASADVNTNFEQAISSEETKSQITFRQRLFDNKKLQEAKVSKANAAELRVYQAAHAESIQININVEKCRKLEQAIASSSLDMKNIQKSTLDAIQSQAPSETSSTKSTADDHKPLIKKALESISKFHQEKKDGLYVQFRYNPWYRNHQNQINEIETIQKDVNQMTVNLENAINHLRDLHQGKRPQPLSSPTTHPSSG